MPENTAFTIRPMRPDDLAQAFESVTGGRMEPDRKGLAIAS